MTRRTWIITGVAAALTVLASGVWTGLIVANARTSTTAVDCCLDPNCPPGCSAICPPACTDAATAKGGLTAKTTCCCKDPTCPPGCSPECPPNCLERFSGTFSAFQP